MRSWRFPSPYRSRSYQLRVKAASAWDQQRSSAKAGPDLASSFRHTCAAVVIWTASVKQTPRLQVNANGSTWRGLQRKMCANEIVNVKMQCHRSLKACNRNIVEWGARMARGWPPAALIIFIRTIIKPNIL